MDRISNDCMLTIFKFMSFQENKSYRTLCKKWERLLKHKQACKYLKLKFTNKNLKYLDQIMRNFPVGAVDVLYTKITDVSALGNVTYLRLCGCTGITDVSALGNVTNLYLSGCTGITDVSALGNITKLSLIKCIKITDVSALGNVTE